MTANEKYLKGMEMVKSGKEPAEIVEALGYKDKQAWWSARCYFQNQKLTKRAAEAKPETPEPAAILEGINVDKVPVPVKPKVINDAIKINEDGIEIATKGWPRSIELGATFEMIAPPKTAKRLTITKEINADGEVISYRAWDGNVSIRRRGTKDSSLVMSVAELRVMMAELGELIGEVEG